MGTDVPESISPSLGLTPLVHGPLAKPWLVLQSMDLASKFCAGSTMLDDLDLGVGGDAGLGSILAAGPTLHSSRTKDMKNGLLPPLAGSA